MYAVIWTYEVRSDCLDRFKQDYSSTGLWVDFFSPGQGYQGTQLLCNRATSNCFLTIDRWDSEASFRRFSDEHREEYEAIDKRCSALTLREDRIGAFVDEAEIAKHIDGWLVTA